MTTTTTADLAAVYRSARGTAATLDAAAPLPPDAWLPPAHPDARAALVHAMARIFVDALDAVAR